ncbi:MAG TPA: phage holin family protein [Thermoleophilaceae bacterium]|nr:phage holin family protein [Thermoleophilaceae bacterium]
MAERNGDNDLYDRPTGELLRELSQQTTELVRQEIDLAKAEIGEKGKQAGIGAGMFGGAGIFGIGAFAALTTAIIAALSLAMDTWIAALIVAVVYGIVAAVLAQRGKQTMQEVGAPVPEQATDSVKEDVQWAKTRMRSGRE